MSRPSTDIDNPSVREGGCLEPRYQAFTGGQCFVEWIEGGQTHRAILHAGEELDILLEVGTARLARLRGTSGAVFWIDESYLAGFNPTTD